MGRSLPHAAKMADQSEPGRPSRKKPDDGERDLLRRLVPVRPGVVAEDEDQATPVDRPKKTMAATKPARTAQTSATKRR